MDLAVSGSRWGLSSRDCSRICSSSIVYHLHWHVQVVIGAQNGGCGCWSLQLMVRLAELAGLSGCVVTLVWRGCLRLYDWTALVVMVLASAIAPGTA